MRHTDPAAAYRLVIRLTETIHDSGTPRSIRREAGARRAVIARRHGIGILRFPPRRRPAPAPDPGRLLIPHCARARRPGLRADDARPEELAVLMGALPAQDVTPPEVVYVACGRPLCTVCAVAEA